MRSDCYFPARLAGLNHLCHSQVLTDRFRNHLAPGKVDDGFFFQSHLGHCREGIIAANYVRIGVNIDGCLHRQRLGLSGS